MIHRLIRNRSTARFSSGFTSGFTLIEVLVVIVIAGVLASIAAPSWLSLLNGRRANVARDQVLQALRQTQQEASRTRSNRGIEFTVGTATALPVISYLNEAGQELGEEILGEGNIKPNMITLQVANGTGTLLNNRVVFDQNGNIVEPEELQGDGIKLVVTVPRDNGRKRCVFISTLIGNMRTESDDQCN